MPMVNKPSQIERYHAFRAQVEHEDQLLGVRLGWLIGSEAFLFAAYASAASVVHDHDHPLAGPGSHLVRLLPLLGIAVAVLVLIAIGAAIRALESLRDECPRPPPPGFPPVVGSSRTHWVALLPPLLIPVALVLAWVYVGFL